MYNKLWLQLTLINVLKKGKRNLIHINHKNQRINTNTEKNYQQTEKCFYALNQFSKDKKVNKSIEVEILYQTQTKGGTIMHAKKSRIVKDFQLNYLSPVLLVLGCGCVNIVVN